MLLASYLLAQVLYSCRLKHEPVLDLALVTGGFLMRAVAGGLAAGLPISDWFLLVAGFGSLFIVAGKRYSELHTLGSEAGTRRSLVRYTDTYLRFVWSIAAAATITAYCLWAFENAADTGIPWHTFSIVPFVIGPAPLRRRHRRRRGGRARGHRLGRPAAPGDRRWSGWSCSRSGCRWLTAGVRTPAAHRLGPHRARPRADRGPHDGRRASRTRCARPGRAA